MLPVQSFNAVAPLWMKVQQYSVAPATKLAAKLVDDSNECLDPLLGAAIIRLAGGGAVVGVVGAVVGAVVGVVAAVVGADDGVDDEVCRAVVTVVWLVAGVDVARLVVAVVVTGPLTFGPGLSVVAVLPAVAVLPPVAGFT